jgi:hypothetical protein
VPLLLAVQMFALLTAVFQKVCHPPRLRALVEKERAATISALPRAWHALQVS